MHNCTHIDSKPEDSQIHLSSCHYINAFLRKSLKILCNVINHHFKYHMSTKNQYNNLNDVMFVVCQQKLSVVVTFKFEI